MDVKLTPAVLRGQITPPPSKSQAHRLIIAAALAEGTSRLSNIALSKDIEATLGCMRALGAEASADGAEITGIGNRRKSGVLPELDCCESGSTLRFLIPVALVAAGGGLFRGRGRLMERPQGPYEDLFAEKGIIFARENGRIRVQGQLRPGTYALPGDVSSQFITGLLYALPLLEGDSEIVLTTELESSGYVDMTLKALEECGITVRPTDHGWYVPGKQAYRPVNATVEADYSQAGFFCAANGIGCQIEINGLREDSAQGDRVILKYCAQMASEDESELDVSQCPDLVPPLAVYAALRGDGKKTRITGAARLRMKESDRLDTVTTQLNALGAKIVQGPDFLEITGVEELHGGSVSACNDHRIAMMLAVASVRAKDCIKIRGAECVAKSYPDFWDDFEQLGGKVDVI